MRKIAVCSIFMGLMMGAVLAAPVQRRGTTGATSAGNTATKTTSARAGVRTTSAPATTATTNARAAVRTTSARSATPAAGAKTTTAPGARAPVAARAGSTQKVISSGTKVATAAKNVVVSEECQAKYNGCMDSFCMIDNTSGGRCICSDKNAEYDEILAEIEKLDKQSYQMATVGVERIEMGEAADAVIAQVNSISDSITNGASTKTGRTSLWDTSSLEIEEEDIFETAETAASPVEGKEGDKLRSAANELCVARIPECSDELSMLQLMYVQKIKSDCSAYENNLKQQKTSSAQKLATAEQALRESALEQYRTANKYDLGQCAVEFKKCMITTAGCGEDFSQCATVVAMDNTNTTKSNKKNKQKMYSIQGVSTTIDISSSTYDTLVAKKPLCESVTKQCVNVADQVWETFLKETAPQLKSAELIAEDNARQDCVGNISSCFQKACKDTMDPDNPDGSYDLCLSRPENMLNVCKIPLNACGVDATSKETAENSNIWDFVIARLSSIRVNACSTAVRQCVQSDNNCGKDYSKCIGLNTTTIVEMCNTDLLTSCHNIYGNDVKTTEDDVYDYVYNVVQGLILDIDNSALKQCQAVLDESMITVCGDTTSCSSMTVDENIGSRSLKYKVCKVVDDKIDMNQCRDSIEQITDKELGALRSGAESNEAAEFAFVIDGGIDWDKLQFKKITETGPKTDGCEINTDAIGGITATIGIDGTFAVGMNSGAIRSGNTVDSVKSELNNVSNNVDMVIKSIEASPQVQFCITGRKIEGVNDADETTIRATRTAYSEKTERAQGRFPNLMAQTKCIIVNDAIKAAKDNYNKKYDELNTKRLQEYVKLGNRIAEINEQNILEARKENARIACLFLAGGRSLPRSTTRSSEKKNGKGSDADDINKMNRTDTKTLFAGQLTATNSMESSSYKETTTATFNVDTLACEVCKVSQTCKDSKNKFCKTWEDAETKCTTTQF